MSQIDRCFDILELFFRSPKGLFLSEIGAQTGIPLATAHRMLGIIKARGYLTQDSREDYHLSLMLPSMGKNFIAGTGFAELNQPHLDLLAKKTGRAYSPRCSRRRPANLGAAGRRQCSRAAI